MTLPKNNILTKNATVEEVDAEILRLMELRAQMVANAKGTKSLLSDTAKDEILRDIRSLCDALVRPKRVAFLGPRFSFTHQATLRFFGMGVDFCPVASIASVFEEVERQQCHFGVVPVENSTDGRVVDALEMFTQAQVQVCGEVLLPIHHALMGRCAESEIDVVFSKPQALSQCRHWLAAHLPNARLEETASTASAAQIAQKTPNSAAVASVLAASAYGLNILAPEIEDSCHNVTRFLVLGLEDAPKLPRSKTTLMFELAHETGALAEALAIFRKNKINLTWIESFPSPNARGKYLFFVDLEGHRSQLKLRRALSALEKKSPRMVVLGSYPAGEVKSNS